MDERRLQEIENLSLSREDKDSVLGTLAWAARIIEDQEQAIRELTAEVRRLRGLQGSEHPPEAPLDNSIERLLYALPRQRSQEEASPQPAPLNKPAEATLEEKWFFFYDSGETNQILIEVSEEEFKRASPYASALIRGSGIADEELSDFIDFVRYDRRHSDFAFRHFNAIPKDHILEIAVV